MKIKYFTHSQMNAFYHFIDQDPKDPRHMALELIALTGMRECELCELSFLDLDPSSNVVTIHKAGKGSNTRSFKLPQRLVLNLIEARDIQGLAANARISELFSSSSDRESRTRYLRKAFEAIKAYIWPGQRVPGIHGFRHTVAKRLYEATGDLYAVKEGLGHVSVLTTERYMPNVNSEKIRNILSNR
jgi:integrase